MGEKSESWSHQFRSPMEYAIANQNVGCSAVILSSLPPDVLESEIYDIFKYFGRILEDGIQVERNCNNFSINAVVKFTSAATVGDILKSDKPILIRGFKLTVKMFNVSNDMENVFDKSNQNVSKPIPPQQIPKIHQSMEKPMTGDPSEQKMEYVTLSTSSTKHEILAPKEVSTHTTESNCNDNQSWKEVGPRLNDNQSLKEFGSRLNDDNSKGCQIRNINTLSSETVLEQYINNERRSNGGSVEKFTLQKDYDLAVVYFKSSDVAKNFLLKQDHILEGHILYVSKLPPICNHKFYLENIPTWVNLDRLSDYMEARARCDVEQIQFRNDNKGSIISLTGPCDASELQRRFDTKPLVNDDQQKANIKVRSIYHPDAILVYGKIPSEDALMLSIEDILRLGRMKNIFVRKVFPKVSENMTMVIFNDYKAVSCFQSGFIKVSNGTFSVAPFSDHLGWIPQKNKINFFRQHISASVTKHLTPLQIEFLSKPVGCNFISDEIDKQKWDDCHFEIDQGQQILVLTASTKNLSEQYANVVISFMKEFEINLDSPMLKTWYEKGSSIKQLINDKDIKFWFCFADTNTKLIILCAHTEFKQIQKMLETFFNDSTVYDESIVENELHGKYLKEFYKKELKSKCSDKMLIKFTQGGKLIASGTKSNIEMLRFDVQVMLSGLEIVAYTVQKPGMSAHFRSSPGIMEIINIANKSQTIIVNETEFDQKSLGTVASLANGMLEGSLNNDIKIAAIHGDLTIQNVDAIVNAANSDLKHCGGLAAAIVNSGGRSIQTECTNYIAGNGALSVSSVFISKSGTLPCKKVIHVVGPQWSGGRMGESLQLRNAIVNCIKAADKEKFSSIAIPAVSTKVFGYPVEKAIPIIVDAVVDACKNTNYIREVRLVDMDQNTVSLFAKVVSSLKCFKQNDVAPKAEPDEKKHVNSFSSKAAPIVSLHGQSSNVLKQKLSKATQLCFNGCTISVLKDDIANAAKQCDVIVSTTAGANLLQGGLACQAITKAAGAAYVTDVNQRYPAGLRNGNTFEVVGKTAAGQLGCKHVYHLHSPAWNPATGEKLLSDKVVACLNLLNSDNCASIAFPAIGTGGLRYPGATVAKVMFDSTINWLKSNPNLKVKSVYFIIYPADTVTVQHFENEYAKRGGHVSPSQSVPTPPTTVCDAVRVGSITVEVIEGDIIKEKSDCIICPTNHNLDLSKGQVARALKEVGGPPFDDVIKASNKSAFKKGVLPVPTMSLLPFKCILFIDEPDENTFLLHNVFMQSLKEASKMNFVSVAVPALGAGQLKHDADEVANMMLQTIQTFASTKQDTNLKLIRIVIFQNALHQSFCKCLTALVTSTENPMPASSSNGVINSAWNWISKKVFSDSSNKTVPMEAKELEKNLILYICGSKASVQHAQALMDKTCEDNCPERTITKDIISSLDQYTIDEMRIKAKQFNVELFISKEQNKIKIKGFRAIDFYEFLTDGLDKMKDELADVVGVQWFKRKDVSSSWDAVTLGVARLEKAYKVSGGKGSITVELEYEQVSVDFDRMVVISLQKDVLYNIKRVTEVDFDKLPKEWNWDDKCSDEYKLVLVDPNSAEYKNVSAAALRTAKNATIQKIECVQNPVKYQQYMVLKRKMEQTVQAKFVAEKNLFHGTAAKNIPGICSIGFNRSLCGQNGVAFGNGSYFARDCSYSIGYGKTIFYARVLTGQYTVGVSGMKVAPDIDPSKGTKYDSVVNNMADPSIFVVFSDNHAYPEYLITFA